MKPKITYEEAEQRIAELEGVIASQKQVHDALIKQVQRKEELLRKCFEQFKMINEGDYSYIESGDMFLHVSELMEKLKAELGESEII